MPDSAHSERNPSQLEWLLAREEIRELAVRYCDCVWRQDVNGVMDLYTEDCLVALKDAWSLSGKEAVGEMYARELGTSLGPRPYLFQHLISDLAAERGSGRCYVDLRDSAHDYQRIGTAIYSDRYSLAAGRWKFAAREAVLVR